MRLDFGLDLVVLIFEKKSLGVFVSSHLSHFIIEKCRIQNLKFRLFSKWVKLCYLSSIMWTYGPTLQYVIQEMKLLVYFVLPFTYNKSKMQVKSRSGGSCLLMKLHSRRSPPFSPLLVFMLCTQLYSSFWLCEQVLSWKTKKKDAIYFEYMIISVISSRNWWS